MADVLACVATQQIVQSLEGAHIEPYGTPRSTVQNAGFQPV